MTVFVECCADKELARTLGVRKRDLHHEHGSDEVMKRLRNWPDSVIGMIDEDPGTGHQACDLGKYTMKDERHGLRLLQRGEKRVVVVSPRLEEWLIDRARLSGIAPGDYGLPESGRALHRIPRYDRKPGFRSFLTELLAADEGMKTLKTWLSV